MEPPPAFDDTIDQKYQRMKADLQAAEDKTDWSWMQGKKERCDFMVASFGLPLRASTDPPSRWFAVFRHTFEPGASALRQGAWPLSRGEEWHRVVVEFQNTFGDAYPCLIAFEVHRRGDGVRILQDFHEPFLNGLTYFGAGELNDGHAMSISPGGQWNVHGPGGEFDGGDRLPMDAPPVFLDPAVIYGMHTSLGAELWCAPIDTPTDAGGVRGSRVVVPLREVKVRHESLAAFELRADYGDGRVKTEDFTPVSFMPYLVGGRTIETVGVPGASDGSWSPVSLTLRAGDQVVATARFARGGSVSDMAWSADAPDRREAWSRCKAVFARVGGYGADELPPPYSFETVSADRRPGVWRGRLQLNLFRAATLGDAHAVDEALRQYADLLALEGHDPKYVIYNAEFLTEWANHWIGRDVGLRLLRDMLLPMYAQATDDQLASHTARLLSQGKYGLACRAACELVARDSVSRARREWARTVVAECDVAAKDPGTLGPFNAGGFAWSREIDALMAKEGLCTGR